MGSLPFGATNAGREDPAGDPLRDFVEFTQRKFRLGLGMDPTDRSIRILIGSKGAGKTIYLRRLQVAADQETSLYADKWRSDTPDTSAALRIEKWSSNQADGVERWTRIWRRAVERAAISHLIWADHGGQTAELPDLDRWNRSKLIPEFGSPVSIYSQVAEIVWKHTKVAALDEYLRRPEWNTVESHLTEALRTSSVMCFYLDALDDYWEAAPRAWLWCQLGLYKYVLALLDDTSLGQRLHVVIGVRDLVYSTIQQGSHAVRFSDLEAQRHLTWDLAAIQHFLHDRIDSLDVEYLVKPDASLPVERWLGTATIVNKARGEQEDLEQYLLRHTRVVPRDVVALGNRLCRLIDRCIEQQNFLLEADIREVVRSSARAFGREALLLVANDITSTFVTRSAVEASDTDQFVDLPMAEGGKAGPMQEAMRTRLVDLLARARKDRISPLTLERLRGHAEAWLGGDVDLPSILWRHGLLGYLTGSIDEGEASFYAATMEDSLELPTGRDGYVLHPILLDTVPGLRGVGHAVHPYDVWDRIA